MRLLARIRAWAAELTRVVYAADAAKRREFDIKDYPDREIRGGENR